MKTQLSLRLAPGLLALLAGVIQLHAQGTAFTYQGRLADGNNSASGIYEMRFTIYDSTNAPGSIIAGPLTLDPVAISNGLFTVTLDFGARVFTGEPRWLGIEIRTNGGGAFTTLAPRQAITATPYAQMAGTVPDAAITGDMLAPGAVGSAQLAVGAVQAANIAPGAITATQLAKPPRAGKVSSGSMALDFGQGDFTVNFSPAFSNPPVVTLALQPYSSTPGEQAALYVKSQSTSGFTGRFSAPAPVQKISDAGTYSSAAIVNGAPAICAGGSPASIQYLRADLTGGSWSTPLKLFLDAGGQDYMRLAVVNGNPAIAYHSNTGAVRFVRATDMDGTAWGAPTTVVASGDSIAFLSFAVVNGHPAIAYFQYPGWDLKYVRATDANGTTWSAPVAVDTAGNVGRTCSLAVVNGNPAISYEDFSNNDLKYIRAADANGAAWGTPVVVDAEGGWQTSLAVVNGQPGIGYSRDPGGTRFIRANDANGDTWGTSVAAGDYGADLSLRVVNGKPAMSFIAGGRLQYARASDANGATWNPPAGLDKEVGGGGTSLIVLPTGVPAISYYGQYSFSEPVGTLRFVREPQVLFDVNWIALEP
jgi:hypothetical protein